MRKYIAIIMVVLAASSLSAAISEACKDAYMLSSTLVAEFAGFNDTISGTRSNHAYSRSVRVYSGEAIAETLVSLRPSWDEPEYAKYLALLDRSTRESSEGLISRSPKIVESLHESGMLYGTRLILSNKIFWLEFHADDYNLLYAVNGEILSHEIDGNIKFFYDGNTENIINLRIEGEDLEINGNDLGDPLLNARFDTSTGSFSVTYNSRNITSRDELTALSNILSAALRYF